MAKISAKASTKAKTKKPKAAAVSPQDPAPAGRRLLARRRALTAALLGVVALLGIGGGAHGRVVAPLIASRERYILQADGITLSELPEWIVGDVRRQVIESSGLAGRLSILDPNFQTSVEHAFKLHPWVESVERIEKQFPPAVHVEVKYRRPVAVVEATQEAGALLVPIDANGIGLPADDVPLIRRTYLPRITGVVGQPPVGRTWDDPRVAGAVDLAVRLADVWESLNLISIVPSARTEVQGERRYFVYDLVNRGGTRIEWGPAPQAAPPGEDDYSSKLDRLKRCVAQYEPLDWVDWPERMNIRRATVEVKARTAKKPAATTTEPVVATKPDNENDPSDFVK